MGGGGLGRAGPDRRCAHGRNGPTYHAMHFGHTHKKKYIYIYIYIYVIISCALASISRDPAHLLRGAGDALGEGGR